MISRKEATEILEKFFSYSENIKQIIGSEDEGYISNIDFPCTTEDLLKAIMDWVYEWKGIEIQCGKDLNTEEIFERQDSEKSYEIIEYLKKQIYNENIQINKRFEKIEKIRIKYNPNTILVTKSRNKIMKILKDWSKEIEKSPSLLEDWVEFENEDELYYITSEYEHQILDEAFPFLELCCTRGYNTGDIDLEIGSILRRKV